MLSEQDIVKKLQEVKPILSNKYNVSSIGYFGSFASGRQNDGSDIDLLVEFSKPVGWEFFKLEQYLEQHFGLRVDLVTKNALKEQMKGNILHQVIYV